MVALSVGKVVDSLQLVNIGATNSSSKMNEQFFSICRSHRSVALHKLLGHPNDAALVRNVEGGMYLKALA